MKRGIGTITTGLFIFASGVITGLLLAPGTGKENRHWLQDNTKGAKKWAELKGTHLLEEGEKRLQKISKELKKSVRNTIPDLYEATSDIIFDDDDLNLEYA